ncbi:MAG: hypothetical protein NDJ89_10660 [Oligoflexia bacterium]|nr:hypothetical protein [Oligoflexia bacterium]
MRAEASAPRLFLALACALSLGGWAAQHFFWELPYRAFFWSQGLLGPVPELLGFSWEDYASSGGLAFFLEALSATAGAMLLTASAATLAGLLAPGTWLARRAPQLLAAASILLAFLALLFFKESGFRAGPLLELSSQVATPALLARWRARSEGTRLAIQAAVALTFFGHGLFAVGFYPVPGNFVDLTLQLVGGTESHARSLLRVVGTLDLLMAPALFIPGLGKAALTYGVLWGFLTTVARPAAALAIGADASALAYSISEMLCRTPHFLLPAALAFGFRWEFPPTLAPSARKG